MIFRKNEIFKNRFEIFKWRTLLWNQRNYFGLQEVSDMAFLKRLRKLSFKSLCGWTLWRNLEFLTFSDFNAEFTKISIRFFVNSAVKSENILIHSLCLDFDPSKLGCVSWIKYRGEHRCWWQIMVTDSSRCWWHHWVVNDQKTLMTGALTSPIQSRTEFLTS